MKFGLNFQLVTGNQTKFKGLEKLLVSLSQRVGRRFESGLLHQDSQGVMGLNHSPFSITKVNGRPPTLQGRALGNGSEDERERKRR